MPDRKTAMRIAKLGADIDSAADVLRGMKIGSPEWLKQNDRLFNLIAKRDRLAAIAEKSA